MNTFYRLDKWLLFAVSLLLLSSAWMMSSVSVYESYEQESYREKLNFCGLLFKDTDTYTTTDRQCLKSEPATEFANNYCDFNNCNDRFLWKHIRNILIALGGLLIMIVIPVGVWRTLSPLIFLGGLGLLFIVLIIPAQGGFTAKSWLALPGFGLFQPSEAMKLALALYAARWMERKKSDIKTFSNGFIPFAVLVFMATFPVVLQPDFGSTVILMAIASSIFWVAGGRFLHMIITGLIGVGIGFIAYNSFEYIKTRFDTFFNPDLASAEDAYQIDQSFLSIGNGGIFGAGDSTQSFGFLPEIMGDMIFSATAEQLGFMGMILIVGLYLFITLRGIRIASRAPDRFTSLTAIGITSWFASQSMVNMMVTTGLFPLTGITLPLFSNGGTSLLITMCGIGILLKISSLSSSYGNTTGRRRKRGAYLSSVFNR